MVSSLKKGTIPNNRSSWLCTIDSNDMCLLLYYSQLRDLCQKVRTLRETSKFTIGVRSNVQLLAVLCVFSTNVDCQLNISSFVRYESFVKPGAHIVGA